MTSFMHTSSGPGIEVAPAISSLAACGFARHANLARVCGAPRCGPARHEHPMQGFVMTRYRKHRLGVMPYLAGFTGARKPLISSFPDGKNRRGSMPESSLTEDAEITPEGNIAGASAPAAIGVDVTGIPSRTVERVMIVDAHMRVDDDPGEPFSSVDLTPRARGPSWRGPRSFSRAFSCSISASSRRAGPRPERPRHAL